MTLIVEDGTGLSNANGYISEAFADAHHGDRGNAAWTGSTTSKEQAIVRATDYVDKRFGQRFRGSRQQKSQALEWPRISALDDDDFLLSDVDDVPRQLEKAIAEYALLAIQINLLPIPARPFAVLDPVTGTVTATGSGQVRRKKEKVGPIEEDTTFADTASLITRTKPGASSSTVSSDFNLVEYPVADEWLRELLLPDFSVELRRA